MIDFRYGPLSGAAVRSAERRMGELEGVFHYEEHGGGYRRIRLCIRCRLFCRLPNGRRAGPSGGR